MMKTSFVLALFSLVAFSSCQSDQNVSSNGDQKRVSTRPASMSTAGSNKVRLSVPGLYESGAMEDVRKALSALPGVTQVLPDLPSNEIVVHASEMVPAMQMQQVLSSFGLNGTVR